MDSTDTKGIDTCVLQLIDQVQALLTLLQEEYQVLQQINNAERLLQLVSSKQQQVEKIELLYILLSDALECQIPGQALLKELEKFINKQPQKDQKRLHDQRLKLLEKIKAVQQQNKINGSVTHHQLGLTRRKLDILIELFHGTSTYDQKGQIR